MSPVHLPVTPRCAATMLNYVVLVVIALLSGVKDLAVHCEMGTMCYA